MHKLIAGSILLGALGICIPIAAEVARYLYLSRMEPQVSYSSQTYPMSDVTELNYVMLLAVDRGDKYEIYKGGKLDPAAQVPDGEPSMQEEDIGQYLEREFSADPTKNAVLVKTSGDIRVRVTELIKRGIDKSLLAKSKTIHFAVKEKQ